MRKGHAIAFLWVLAIVAWGGAGCVLGNRAPAPAPTTQYVDTWTDHGDLLRCYVWDDRVTLFCERLDAPQ